MRGDSSIGSYLSSPLFIFSSAVTARKMLIFYQHLGPKQPGQLYTGLTNLGTAVKKSLTCQLGPPHSTSKENKYLHDSGY